jgi:hypothetical protein
VVAVLLRCTALVTPFIYSNSSCMSFFGFSALDYSFCIFDLYLYVILRCTAPDYSLCISLKKDIQEELEDTKRSNQWSYTEEDHTRRVWRYNRCNQGPYTWLLLYYLQTLLVCPSSVYGPLLLNFVSSNSSCVSIFAVRPLITTFISSNYYCVSYARRVWIYKRSNQGRTSKNDR